MEDMQRAVGLSVVGLWPVAALSLTCLVQLRHLALYIRWISPRLA